MLAKQIVIRELERSPQTKHAISATTGLKFNTVQGTITRLVDAGAVHSDSVVDDEFKPGGKRKIYKLTQRATA